MSTNITKRVLVFSILLMGILISISYTSYTNENQFNKRDIIAIIDGEEIYDEVDFGLFLQNGQGIDISANEYVLALVKDRLIEKEVGRLGIGVSESLYQDYLIEIKESYNFSDETRTIFDEALKINGLTEDEYWRITRPYFEKLFNRAIYKEYIMNEYYLTDNDREKSETNDLFEEYFEEKVDELFTYYKTEIIYGKTGGCQ